MQTRAAPKIFLYSALPCEAKPLIDVYKLKKEVSLQAFSIFRNDDTVLTVTGIGKTAMAAGVAYSQALFPGHSNPVILNIGIAGHQQHQVGTIFLAEKITDADTGRRYFPPLTFTPFCPTTELITYAKPQQSYPESALCDMEASAFYETSSRFSTGELCQCLKLVSDNILSPAGQIQAQAVSNIIYAKLTIITQTVSELSALAKRLPNDGNDGLFELISERYRFSVNEQIQLNKCLTRWRVMTNLSDLDPDDIPAKTGKEFLDLLTKKLDAMAFTL